MKQSEWRRAYEPDPVRLEARVRHTLKNLDADPAARPHALRTALIAALVLALLCGIALAVYESRTADLVGWFGGEERKEALLSGDIAPSGESTRLGDVVYTLDDVIYKDGTIYGSGVIRAAEGANIVLIDENSGIYEPAGYPLHYGKDYTVPDDAPSYVELAKERGARLILAKCVADGVLNENGEQVGDFANGPVTVPGQRSSSTITTRTAPVASSLWASACGSGTAAESTMVCGSFSG